MLFLEGLVARFFESFAVVVTVGVMVSLLVSLTLTPMLCSRFMTVGGSHGPVYRFLDRILAALDASYRAALDWTLRHRLKVLLATLAIVATSGVLFERLGKDFIPQDDDGRFQVFFRGPLGTSREAMSEFALEIERTIAAHPEIKSLFIGVGLGGIGQVNTGTAFIDMVPLQERSISQAQMIATLQAELATIPGVFASVAAPSPIGGQRGEQLQFSVVGPELGAVAELSRQLLAELGSDPAMGRIDLDLQLDLPQLKLEVDRERAADVGLGTAEVAYAVNLLAGGIDVARFNDVPGDGDRYDLRLKAADGEITTADDLRRIFLRTPQGQLVRLDTVARGSEVIGPAVINRFGLQYAANFYSNPTLPLGTATQRVQAAAAELLPPGYSLELQGRTREFAKTSGYVAFAFGLALVLVYIVLASQFNSFIQPLIVMTAQPLAMVGGLFALWVTGSTLNMISMIGLVLLIGLVAKNSILLVDLTNQLRAQGRPVDVALREACPVRLRPVLMTSLTVILAMLPAALGLGAGAETNRPMAIAVIGGMVSSTLLTLVVVPTVYSAIESGLARWRRHRTGSLAA